MILRFKGRRVNSSIAWRTASEAVPYIYTYRIVSYSFVYIRLTSLVLLAFAV